jgi:polar amino acid transport system substrate-binding protein
LSVGFLSLVLVGLAAGVSAQQPLTVGLDATFAPHAMPKMGGGGGGSAGR